ncbi:hypothetical protein AMATHDRAFT_1879 [Amanita thiersii Skay4041]|uniref:Uncharacterized protein n=1 Tax=Amanita thiersii Skay4041 TaxID=703135 RepID=A0A2A9NWW0_9AGAR|nr:hypothetical protein AMATHDRAFT_1879 [Amanita thiersii Skay4041]
MSHFFSQSYLVMLLFLFLLTPIVHALSIHHRLYHPLAPNFYFSPRAHVSLNPQLSYSPSSSISDDLASSFQRLLELDLDPDAALYQLALEHDNDSSIAHWDVSSVKLCHLVNATSDSFLFHTKGDYVYAIDYFVSPIPHDGSCPKRKANRIWTDTLALAYDMSTSIKLVTPRLPPLPELRVPPPLSPDGEPVKPVPEKSFIQKYWMYILAILIALMASGGTEEDQPQRRTS